MTPLRIWPIWGVYTQSGGPHGFDHKMTVYSCPIAITEHLWRVLVKGLDNTMQEVNIRPSDFVWDF